MEKKTQLKWSDKPMTNILSVALSFLDSNGSDEKRSERHLGSSKNNNHNN